MNFSAAWCGPCLQIAPTFSELSDKYTSVLFLTVDVDDLAVSWHSFKTIDKIVKYSMIMFYDMNILKRFLRCDGVGIECNMGRQSNSDVLLPERRATTGQTHRR